MTAQAESGKQASEAARGYRKGIVIGLTLAEVALILVFVLLMMLVLSLKTRERLEQQQRSMTSLPAEEVAQLVAARDAIRTLNAALNPGYPPEQIPDNFQELVKELAALNDSSRGASAVEALSAAEKKAAAERAALSKILESQAGKTPSDASKLVDEIASYADRDANQQGQIKALQKQLADTGKGGDLPSCLTDPDGHIVYLFDATLESDGIRLEEHENPGREAERTRLPIRPADSTELLSATALRLKTVALDEYSKTHNCRFYVRVVDRTGPSEKGLYKQLLKAVEEHFYKLLVQPPTG